MSRLFALRTCSVYACQVYRIHPFGPAGAFTVYACASGYMSHICVTYILDQDDQLPERRKAWALLGGQAKRRVFQFVNTFCRHGHPGLDLRFLGPLFSEAYYMRLMARLIRESHARRTLVVKLEHVAQWQPQGAPVQNAGMRLAEHIRKNYIR